MSSLVFPALPGLSWSVYREPNFSVTMRESESLREAGEVIRSNCGYNFKLSYEMLRNKNGYAELDSIQGLFLAMRGSYDYFRFTDPHDNTVTAGSLGVGNGTNKVFILARNTGPSYFEAVGYLNTLTGVYLNGVLQSGANYTFTAPNVITFVTAPGAGVVVTATFTYYFLCRFSEDMQEYDQFCSTMYELQEVNFQTVPM